MAQRIRLLEERRATMAPPEAIIAQPFGRVGSLGVMHDSAPDIAQRMSHVQRSAASPLRPSAALDFGSIAILPPEPQVGSEGGQLSSDLADRIRAQQRGGMPLEPSVQQRMEGAFGHNFADVRIHADGESDVLSSSLGANAFTLGSDIFLGQQATGAGAAVDELVAHELTHVVQQRGAQQGGQLMVGAAGDAWEREAEDVAAGMSASERAQKEGPTPLLVPSSSATKRKVPLAPRPLSMEDQAVQREPQPKAATPTTVEPAIGMVVNAYRKLFNNQRSGLHRLEGALQKKKADSNLIASLAAGAVGAALKAVLGPVGPAAEALVEEGVGRLLIKKSIEMVTEKAVEKAKDGMKEWISEPKKTNPIDNFIEAQSLAINDAEEGAVDAFQLATDGFRSSPKGPAALQALKISIDEQAKVANSVQIAHSAGAWASHVASEDKGRMRGSDSKQWANEDVEDNPEKGAIEIDAHVKTAPITGPGDIQITGSNWRGINRETERVVQEHGGAKIEDLESNLRITVDTPVGQTHCEISAKPGNPTIPEKSTLQGVMIWLIRGGHMNPSPLEDDRAAVLSSAAVLGYYMQQKPVTELHFE